MHLTLFYRLPHTILKCFSGYYLLAQIVAVYVTYLCVSSGFDWWYYSYTYNSAVETILFPSVFIGFFLPIVLPLYVIISGTIKKNIHTVNTGWALGQAIILGSALSSTYKAFTGRLPPGFLDGTAGDISHEFQFGFMHGGIFWGWPSSHTTIAFAMATTFIILYPKKKILGYVTLLYALYIGLGVSMSVHWFSEFAAGAILGTVIGMVVGQSFLNRYQQLKKHN